MARTSPPLFWLGADAGHLADRLAVAVIGGVGADDAALAGGAARHAQRHLVGLGARAAEDDALDRRTVERRDAFRQGDDAFVQVAAVHVERRLLARHRLDDVRVGMPDARHVVVHVDVAAARLVEQVHALAADDVQGLVVEQRRSGSQRPVASGGKRRRTHAGPLLRGVVWDPIMVSRTAGFQPAHCWERATSMVRIMSGPGGPRSKSMSRLEAGGPEDDSCLSLLQPRDVEAVHARAAPATSRAGCARRRPA